MPFTQNSRLQETSFEKLSQYSFVLYGISEAANFFVFFSWERTCLDLFSLAYQIPGDRWFANWFARWPITSWLMSYPISTMYSKMTRDILTNHGPLGKNSLVKLIGKNDDPKNESSAPLIKKSECYSFDKFLKSL